MGCFTNETGWMRYGRFNFASNVAKVNNASGNVYNPAKEDEVFPFLTTHMVLHPHPSLSWQNSGWSWYGSWADQGLLFYYFYLLKRTGAILDSNIHDHETIHFVSRLSSVCY